MARRRLVALGLAVAVVVAVAAPSAVAAEAAAPKEAPKTQPLTDEVVLAAIEKGRNYLIAQANPDGSFGKTDRKGGHSALVFMTLAYMGEHPNEVYMTNGLNFLLGRDADMGGFEDRPGYAVPIRIMGFSYIYKKLLGDKRRLVALKARQDLMRLAMSQQKDGGWRYQLKPTESYDFSVTQWPILAMRDAARAGIEFPDPRGLLQKSLELYYKYQQASGGWYYEGKGKPPSGSMTAAGLASLYIIGDFLEPNSGCPCTRAGHSQGTASRLGRSMDQARKWIVDHFATDKNPNAEDVGKGWTLYWLYCVERVGIAGGYKYFGEHHWYKEGAEAILKQQQKNGSWGDLEKTCFALLFLYKGRAPVLFNKLKFGDEKAVWNAHRRDIANLTHFIEQKKEQPFHWQIVELKAPLEELHDAPILYITAETPPEFPEAHEKKLRAFTDTGGTILFEASCGNPAVRSWFMKFVRRVWPEYKIARLDKDHGIWTAVNKLARRPEIFGLDDGVRTFLFYSPDDISCAWQTQALTAKIYLFDWGTNLYTYATDGALLRGKLAGRAPTGTDRFAGPVKAGKKTTIRLARVRHAGDWATGASYGGLEQLAAHLKSAADITLEPAKPAEAGAPGGVAPADLGDCDVAYLAGSGAFALEAGERQALKAYLDRGGFLWAESVTGAAAFHGAFRKLADEMGCQIKLLPGSHPLMNGRMDPGLGYNLTTGVTFRRTLRTDRIGRPSAEFWGLYDGAKLIGVYSPFDITFSLTGLEAFACRGYQAEDAVAVATNLAIYFSTR